MNVAIITDTHYGCRKGSKIFHDYFEKFYKNIFFPKLEEENIDTVIHLGDAFDSRKSIDYQSLEWTKRVVLNPLSKYDTHMLIGNHDAYYKNTNNINSPSLLLKSYSNIKTYKDPVVVNIGGLNILLIPWICADNQDISNNLISSSKCKVAMGHLELSGFEAYKGHIMEDGMDSVSFDNYEKVFSGHYHTRSDNGKIFYLGNPYEMFWNDVGDCRGFTIFNTETLEHYHIDNPYTLFKIVYYEDTNYMEFDYSEYEGKIIKVIVKKKSSTDEFEKFINKFYNYGISELKIVENFQTIKIDNFELFESEDTLSILNRYVDISEIEMNKSKIKDLIYDVYQESCLLT